MVKNGWWGSINRIFPWNQRAWGSSSYLWLTGAERREWGNGMMIHIVIMDHSPIPYGPSTCESTPGQKLRDTLTSWQLIYMGVSSSSWGYPTAGWFLWTGKSHLEMDDDWGVDPITQETTALRSCGWLLAASGPWDSLNEIVTWWETLWP